MIVENNKGEYFFISKAIEIYVTYIAGLNYTISAVLLGDKERTIIQHGYKYKEDAQEELDNIAEAAASVQKIYRIPEVNAKRDLDELKTFLKDNRKKIGSTYTTLMGFVGCNGFSSIEAFARMSEETIKNFRGIGPTKVQQVLELQKEAQAIEAKEAGI